ncbi:uracil-DNA glycosylase [Rhodoferax sp.]|uniref:uracil-DNA glycosylase n=1 Tax=Rhodoferax sp. TaxID=50421 RepID=UPI00284A4726|nr:uracil-DNA glycosylase [Rhodoferax sp.]MDR3369140.1 uracil-DNA glycosylase [Rhodoferax sp.]
MSLDLDIRQRAMLAEMGVRVWWPDNPAPDDALALATLADLQADSDQQSATDDVTTSPYYERATDQNRVNSSEPAIPRQSAPQAATVPVPPVAAERPTQRARQPLAARPPVVGAAVPTAVTTLPPGIEGMDWPALQATVSACQACVMCLGRRAPVLAAPSNLLRADWLVLGEPPDDAQERTGEPFVEDAGVLLDNMLKAVGVQRHLPGDAADAAPDEALGNAPPPRPDPARTAAYLSLVLKCRPALPTAPDAQALAACAHYLRREIALVQPKIILAMGRLAMQVLLSEDHPQGLKLPLGKLRGQVWHYQGVPVVVTYPPAYLLRNGQDKARAWQDLCLAADVAQGVAAENR